MQVDLVKKCFTSKKDNKNCTFIYLRLDSGRLIPISVKTEKNEEGVIKNPHDYSVISALATKIN